MKFRCHRDRLHRAVQAVAGVADSKNIKPVLRDICFRVSDNMIELSATDLEVGMKYMLSDVEVESTGGMLVSAQNMGSILRDSPDEMLQVETEEGTCHVRGSDAWFRLLGESIEEFPDIPDFPEGDALTVDSIILKEMVQKTRFAVASVRSTYALNGSLWVMEEGKKDIEMVGADGRRLARIRRKAATAAVESARVIIPVKALMQLERMAGGEEPVPQSRDEEVPDAEASPAGVGPVSIRIDERRLLAKAGNGVLVAQLVEGRYPDYQDILPTDCDKKIEFARDALFSAVRRAALMADRERRSVVFHFSPGKVVIEAEEAQTGEAKVQLPLQYEGEDIRLVFNPDFITDMLRVTNEESVFLEFKSPSTACLFKAGSDYVYLVMLITRDQQ